MSLRHEASSSGTVHSSPYGTAFFVVLALKILAGSTLGSHFIRDLTSPFVQWTLENLGSDPWSAFLSMGQVKAFPYHPGMLLSLLPGRLLTWVLPDPGWQVTTWVDLISLRLPMLAADLGIYLALLRLTQMPRNRATWIYWANPIVFYITYIHGQLDIIPVALLVGTLYFLRGSRLAWAALAFGASVGTKSTALLLLPVFATYVVRTYGWKRASAFVAIALSLAGALILPMLGSPGYRTLVLGAEEQYWLFKYAIDLPVINASVYLSVLALALCYLKVISVPRINLDLAIAFGGLCIVVVLVLVPPMPGWFMWLVPSLAYLGGLGQGRNGKSLAALSAAFLVWFLVFAPTADALDVFQTVAGGPLSGHLPPNLPSEGLGAFLPGLCVTTLMATLLYCAYELWKRGIASNEVYRRRSAVVVGVAGDSAAGKDTLCRFLAQLLGPRRVLQMDGDDYHRWARSDPRYARFSHLHPASNRLHQQRSDLNRLAHGEPVESPRYDHASGTHTSPLRRDPKEFLLVSGLHTLLLEGTQPLFDLRIFLDPDPILREHWKLQRDTIQRGHTADEVRQQMAERAPDSNRFVQPQQEWADLCIRFRLRPDASLAEYTRAGPQALALQLVSSPAFDWDSPIALLDQASKDLHVDVDIASAGQRASLTFTGTISPEALASVARSLIPNLHELTDERPRWEPGLNGVAQLFVLHYMAQARRLPDWEPALHRG